MSASANLKNHVNISVNEKSDVIQAPEEAANFLLSANIADVLNYARSGDSLVIAFKSGQKVEIKGFFSHGASFNNLVFISADGRYLANFDEALSPEGDGIIDAKVAYEEIRGADSVKVLLGLLGGGAVAGGLGAAAAGGSGNNDGDHEIALPVAPPAKPETPPSAWDNTGPVTGPIESGKPTDETQPELSGKGTPGNEIIIRDGDRIIGEVTVDEDGNWKWKPETPLDDGRHEITVSEKDRNGNESEPSDPIIIDVDTTPPATPSAPPSAWDNTGPVTGPIEPGKPTDETQPEFSGKGEPGDTIIIRDGDEIIGEVPVDEDGNWKWKPETPLDDGDHSITVSERDPAGNESDRSPSIDFEVDTTPPATPSAPPSAWDNTGPVTGPIEPGKPTDETQPEFSGKGEPGDTIIIRDGDEIIAEVPVDEDGNWKWKPETPLDDGRHHITVSEKDKAGNESDRSPSIDFEVDTTPPATPSAPPSAWDNTGPVTGPIEPGKPTDETQPEFSGKGEPGDTIIIRDGDEIIGEVPVDEDGNWKWKPETPLDDGDHSITVSEKDKAGNESDRSPSIDFEVDTTPPETPSAPPSAWDDTGTITGPIKPGKPTDETQPEFSGKGEPGDTIVIRDGDEVIGEVTVDEDGNWKWKPETPLDDGRHHITVSEKDKAGNESDRSPSIDFEVDTIPPAAPAIPRAEDITGDKRGEIQPGDITDEHQPVLSGRGEPGNEIIIRDGDEELGRVTVGRDGKWLWPVPANKRLSDGKHSITVTETDKAGNVSETSPALDFEVMDPGEGGRPAKPETAPDAEDNTGPVTGPIESGKPTDETQPELSGKGTPGNEIIIRDGDEIIGEVTVDEDGNWKWKPETPFDDGDHSITVSEKDKAGNEGEPSDPIIIDVDTTPPKTPSTPPSAWDNEGPVTGPIKPGGITDDRMPEFSGKGEPGDTIVIRDGDEVIGEVTVDEDGNWKWKPETPIGGGDHSITVSERDPAGNESGRSPSIDFEVDTGVPSKPETPPSAWDDTGTITGPIESGKPTDETQPEFSGKGTPGNEIVIRDGDEIVGEVTVDEDGNWKWKPETPFDEGDHSITVSEKDRNGNEGEPSDPIIIDVDTTPPATPSAPPSAWDDTGIITGPIESGKPTDESRPEFSGKGEPGDTIVIRDGDEIIGEVTVDEDGTWQWKPETPLDDGVHYITVSEKDPAGNESGRSPSIDIIVDTESPTATAWLEDISNNIGSEGKFVTADNTQRYTIKVDGTLGQGETVWLRITGPNYAEGKWIQAFGGANDHFYVDQQDIELGDGTYIIETVVRDRAGNEGPVGTAVIEIHAQPPETPVLENVQDNTGDVTGPVEKDGRTDETQPVLSGKGAPGNTINIYDHGALIGITTVKEDGTWTWDPKTYNMDLNGEIKLTISQTNEFGVESAKTPEFNFTIDTAMLDNVTATLVAVSDDTGVPGDFITSDNTLKFTIRVDGELQEGDTVRLRFRDQKTGWSEWINAVRIGEGLYEVDYTGTVLGDGKYSVETIVQNKIGNRSVAGRETVIVDTEAPTYLPEITEVWDKVGSVQGLVQNGGVTDDTMPYLVGKGMAGDTVIIYVDGKEVGTAIVSSDGYWVYYMPALGEGHHSITVSARDKAGNQGEMSPPFNLTVDTTAPAIPEEPGIWDEAGTTPIDPSKPINEDRPVLKGEGEPGDTIVIRDGGKIIGEVTVDEDGTWQWQPETPLDDGRHHITVSEKDEAGNESDRSPSIDFEVDTTPPATPSAPPSAWDNTGPVTGPIEPGKPTDESRPEFSGKGEPGDTIIIRDGDEIIAEVPVNKDGTWKWKPETPLDDGDHCITVSEKDKAGNESGRSPSIDFEVDTSGPDQPSIKVDGSAGESVRNGVPINNNKPELSGTGERGSIITIRDGETVLGTAVVDENGNWTWNRWGENGLTDDTHTITVTATDEAGNTSVESDGIVVTVDTTPPVANVPEAWNDEDTAGGIRIRPGDETNDTTPELKGKGEPGSTITIIIDSKEAGTATVDEDGNWRWTPETPLDEGRHSIAVVETDKAGNRSEASPSLDFKVDTTAPAAEAALDRITDDSGVAGDWITNDTTPTYWIKVSGTLGEGETIWLHIKGTGVDRWVEASRYSDGQYYVETAEMDKLADGSYTIETVVRDRAGNEGQPHSQDIVIKTGQSLVVPEFTVYDNTGPVTGEVLPRGTTDDDRPELRGTNDVGAGNRVLIYVDGRFVGETVAGENGTWRFEIPANQRLGDGSHRITVEVRDNADNSRMSGEFEFTVSTVVLDVDAVLESITDDSGVAGDFITNDNTLKYTVRIDGARALAEDEKVLLRIVDKNGNVIENWIEATRDGDRWTVDLTGKAFGDGEYIVETIVRNEVGNESAAGKQTVVIDTTPPVITDADAPVAIDDTGFIKGPVRDGGVTDDTTPELRGRGEPGSTITIIVDGKEAGTTTVDKNGNWSFTPTLEGDGDHTITVTETDRAGNTSEPKTITVELDTTPPTADVILDRISEDTGIDGTDRITKNGILDYTVKLSDGTVEETDTVWIRILDKNTHQPVSEWIEAVSNGDGTWTAKGADHGIDLPHGSYEVEAAVRDEAGNQKEVPAENRVEVIIDKLAPDVPTIDEVLDRVEFGPDHVAQGGVTNDPRPVFSGRGEPGSIVIILNNGVEAGRVSVDENGNWSWMPGGALAEWVQHRITVKAVDKAGNESEQSPSFDFTVDVTPPGGTAELVEISEDTGVLVPGSGNDPKGEDFVTNDNTLIYRIAAENVREGDTVWMRIQGNGIDEWIKATRKGDFWEVDRSAIRYALDDGDYTITVAVRDAAGNQKPDGELSHKTITIDTTAPDYGSLVINEAESDLVNLDPEPVGNGGLINDSTPTLRGIASGLRQGDRIVIREKGTGFIYGEAVVNEDGSWEFTFSDNQPLRIGGHILEAIIADQAGNLGTRSVEFELSIVVKGLDSKGEIQGPIISGGITDDTQIVISGVAEKGVTVEIWEGGQKLASVTSDQETGRWEWRPADTGHEFSEDDHKLIIKGPGLGETDEVEFEFEVDTTPPAATAEISGISRDTNPTGVDDNDFITSDNTLIISIDITGQLAGPSDARSGDTVWVHIQGKGFDEWRQARVDYWKNTATVDLRDTELADGEYTITAEVRDSAGNRGNPADQLVIVDTTPPENTVTIDVFEDNEGSFQGDFGSGTATDDKTPTLKGKVNGAFDPDDVIVITRNGVYVGTASINADGSWRFELPALHDGKYEYVANIVDKAGNKGPDSNHFELTVVTTVPVVPVDVVVIDDVGPKTGPIGGAVNVTDDTRPTVSGRINSAAGLEIIIYDNGVEIGRTGVNPDGTWSWTVPEGQEFADGSTHRITVTSRNAVGTESTATNGIEFTVDTTPPTATAELIGITEDRGPSDSDFITSDTTLGYKIKVTGELEPGATVMLHITGPDGFDKWYQATKSPFEEGVYLIPEMSRDILADGRYTVETVVRDIAGNDSKGPDSAKTVVIDTTMPSMPTFDSLWDNQGTVRGEIGPEGGRNHETDDARPTLSGTGDPNTLIAIYIDGTLQYYARVDANGDWSFELPDNLGEGRHSISVAGTNAAGNETARTPEHIFVVDTEAPEIRANVVSISADTGAGSNDFITSDTRPSYTIRVERPLKDTDTVWVRIVDAEGNKTAWMQAVKQPNGEWVFSDSKLPPLEDGTYTIETVVRDAAGNQNDNLITGKEITIDTIAPDAPEITGMNGDTASGGATGDNYVEFRGTAEANSVVELWDNGVMVGKGKADANGNWLITGRLTGDGEHHITATATDIAGNKSDPSAADKSWTVTVDTTPPATPAIVSVVDNEGSITGEIGSNGNLTNDPRPVISGTGSEEGNIIIIRNQRGVELARTTVKDGKWSVQIDRSLTEGVNRITVVERDSVGNTSAASDPREIILDTLPPAVPPVTVTVETENGAGSIVDGVTNKAPTLSGRTEADAIIIIRDGGVEIGRVVADKSGNWSIRLDLGDGNHTITVTSTDKAGNESGARTVPAFEVDTTPPAATSSITAISDDTGSSSTDFITSDNTLVISGKVTGTIGAGERVQIRIDGDAWVDVVYDPATGTWVYDNTGVVLSNGDHTVETRVVDKAGNFSEAGSQTITVIHEPDLGVPAAPAAWDDIGVTGWIRTGDTTDDNKPGFSGKGRPGDTVIIRDGDRILNEGETITVGADGTWAWTPKIPLGDGGHSITVSMVDKAGNESRPSDSLDFTVDTAPPATPGIPVATDNQGPVTGAIGQDGVTDDVQPVISGKGAAGSTITIRDGDKVLGVTTVREDGTWEYTPSRLDEGGHSITVTETNKAGVTSEQSPSLDFTVDTIAPDKPALPVMTDDEGPFTGVVPVDENGNAVTDDTTPEFSGRGEAGSTITIRDGDRVLGTTTIGEDGTWAWTPETPLPEGSHEITVTETDVAGNTSEPSDTLHLVVDTTGPDDITAWLTAITEDRGSDGQDFITSDNTLVYRVAVSRALEDGETVWLRVVDASDPSKVAVEWVQVGSNDSGSGFWLDLTGNPLADGRYKVEVTVRDRAGNQGPVSSTDMEIDASSRPAAPGENDFVIIDDVGEITGQIKSGAVTDDNRPEIKGTTKATPGSTIVIRDNGREIGRAVVDENGDWSFTPRLEDGRHSITITVEDRFGNLGEASPPVDFDVDTTPPTAISSITAISDDTGSSSTDFITSDNTLVISGKVTGTIGAGERVQIRIDGDAWVDVVYDPATGTWVYDNTGVVLSNGDHTIETRVVDRAGNANSGQSQVVVIDTSKPIDGNSVSIISFTDDTAPNTGDFEPGSATNDRTPTLNGTVSGLRPGDYIKIYQIHNGVRTYLGVAKVSADGTSWAFTVPELRQDGDYSYEAVISSIAGAEGTKSDGFDLTLITGAPVETATITGITTDTGISSNDFVTSDKTLVISARVDQELKAGQRVQIGVDGQWHDAVRNAASGLWELDYTGVELSEGNHKLSVRIVDDAGNSGPEQDRTLVIDSSVTQDVVVMITDYDDNVGTERGKFGSGTVTDDRMPVLNGTINKRLADDEMIVIYNNGVRVGEAKINADGTGWSFELPSLVNNTDNKLTAVIEDVAGNRGAQSPDFDIRVELSIRVDQQITTNHTPIITGEVEFDIQEGEYVEVTVNGVTYSSKNGMVVVDPRNNTWYVRIPDAAKLGQGIYDVVAVLKGADEKIIATDTTGNELQVVPEADVNVGAAGGSADEKATAVTMDENGNWMIFTNQAVLRSNGTDNSNIGSFSNTPVQSQRGGSGNAGRNQVQNGTWMDYDRDGYMDFFGSDNTYGNGQQAFLNNGDGTFTPRHVGWDGTTLTPNNDEVRNVDANVFVWYGGVAAFDKTGTGYASLIYGDQTPGDPQARGGFKTQIVINTDGTMAGFKKDGNYITNTYQHADIDMEVSGVDLDNNGTVDLAYHGTGGIGLEGSNLYKLVLAKNQGDGSWTTSYVDGVFNRNSLDSNVGNGEAMTWADFDGDGYMDLFLGNGHQYVNSRTSNESVLYLNDGNGSLYRDEAQSWFGDDLAGGASLAVDWNHDGRMDIIELPAMAGGVISLAKQTGPINLYLNDSPGKGQLKFTTQQLVESIGKANPVTGAIAIDVDWDGAKDLLVFTQKGETTFIRNENEIAHGTSLHFKILDQEGINAFYGNTVQLFDSKGNLVGTQILNPQSGNQTNDSTAIVDFFGLDPDETYSLLLLRNINGVEQHVGGLSSLGGKMVSNVNAMWNGLKAGAANEAHVLTAESDQAENMAMAGNGIVGTGYNDIFVATKGAKAYSGAGGTVNVAGEDRWSNTGGTDVIDFKLAGTQGVRVDLGAASWQNTGFNVVQLRDIEGVYGAQGNDEFIASKVDNVFNGRGGNDTFRLGKDGGHVTLLYELIGDDGTGGNGYDTVYDFFVGTYEATKDADRIDLSELLIGYKADDDGAAHYINGVATIDAGDRIEDYLKVTRNGTDTILSIDRDGAGGAYGFEDILTLKNVDVDLATLLANHQIIIG